MKNLVTALLFFPVLAFSQTSMSKRYESFDTDSKERLEFVLSENHQTNEYLKKSPNFKKISNQFLKEYGAKLREIKAVEVGETTYKAVDLGLGKPQNLIKVVGEKEEILFSSFEISRNNTFSIVDFFLSPDLSKAIIVFNPQGSIDDYGHIVLDLASKKILGGGSPKIIRPLDSSSFFWLDNENFIYEDHYNQEDPGIFKATISDLDIERSVYVAGGSFGLRLNDGDGPKREHLIYTDGENKYFYLSTFGNTKDGQFFKDEEYLGSQKDVHFLGYKNKETKQFDIRKIKITNDSIVLLESFSLPKTYRSYQITESFIFGFDYLGFRRELDAYAFSDKKKYSIKIPAEFSFDSAEEVNPGIVNLSFSTELNDVVVKWDVKKVKSPIPTNAVQKALTLPDGKILAVRYIMVKSFDETLVPIKLVSLKGLALKNRPVFMESYGGFEIDGYTMPAKDLFREYFIRRGGVYVGTGIRGGDEFKEEWHKSAIREKRFRTYEDLASIAKWLIDTGISSKQKIVSSGSSNGGLTVATTALLYPNYFGLVIPHNGVLDLLAKERLDVFMENGWTYEYGDSREPGDRLFLERLSPLELLENRTDMSTIPKFLVVNGRNDSRVNPAHSYKFVKALRDLGFKDVNMIGLNNSGHFNLSLTYNDLIGWRAKSIQWAYIYDYLMMSF